MIDRALIESALPLRDQVEVAHYTRLGTLAGMLRSSGGWTSAWATPVQFLNDRKELTLGLEALDVIAAEDTDRSSLIRHQLDELIASSGSPESDAYQMSFSGNPDELGQWRGYAANGYGCAVVTSVTSLNSVAAVSGWVIYDREEQKLFARRVIEGVSHLSDELELARTLVAAASFMKHPGFAPEAEYRLLCFPCEDEIRFRESGNRLVPYFDFLGDTSPLPVSRIVIGPGWQLATLSPEDQARHHVPQALYRLLSARGLRDTGVESSALPYDPM